MHPGSSGIHSGMGLMELMQTSGYHYCWAESSRDLAQGLTGL